MTPWTEAAQRITIVCQTLPQYTYSNISTFPPHQRCREALSRFQGASRADIFFSFGDADFRVTILIETFFNLFWVEFFSIRTLILSSSVFEFLFRMFSLGDTSPPTNGMRAIPDQICARLPPDAVRLNSPVNKVMTNTVSLGSGEQLSADAVVIATRTQ